MEVIDMDVNWFQIGKVAEDFNITVNRLRGWCDNELVEFRTDEHNVRFIPESEYAKIKRIIELTGQRKVYPTLKHVREQLMKEDLFHNHQAELQEKHEVEKTSKIMEQAFEKMEFGETFAQMAESYAHMRQEIAELRKIIENQGTQKLLENEESKKEIRELKEQNTIIIDSIQTLKSPEQERAERLDTALLLNRVERKLRMEALDIWSKKPKKERGGTLFASEDTALRDKFVEEYVDEHIDDELKKRV